MFREQLREGGDRDIKLVLSVLRDELLGVLLCESLGFPKGGNRGFVGGWISQRSESNWVRVYSDVSVFLVLK